MAERSWQISAFLCHRKSLFTDGCGRFGRNVVSPVIGSACSCVWENSRLENLSYIKLKKQDKEGEIMASISLCMIVRNEEKVLGRCLSCVRGFADEIIIVDTGSTDRTKEIAFSFTDKVYDFKWKDDFAAARNFAFSKGTGDYLFWLDADDVVRQEERRKLMDLKRQLDDERPDVVMMKYAVGYDGDGEPSFFFYRERLLRRCGKAVWKGRIHEAVEPFGKVVREDIMIEHRKVGTGDPDRNLRIFEQMLREKGKLSPRDQYYYGKELYYHRRYRDAASVFSEYLELPDGWREDRVDACRHGAYCMYRIGDRDRALKFLLSGLSEGIPKPELCCDLGWWFFSAKRYRDAIFWYGQAVQAGKLTGEDGFVMPECRGYVPYLQMCVCYDRLGEWKTAERYNELAERCRPGTETCQLNRKYFEKRKEQQIEWIQ